MLHHFKLGIVELKTIEYVLHTTMLSNKNTPDYARNISRLHDKIYSQLQIVAKSPKKHVLVFVREEKKVK